MVPLSSIKRLNPALFLFCMSCVPTSLCLCMYVLKEAREALRHMQGDLLRELERTSSEGEGEEKKLKILKMF